MSWVAGVDGCPAGWIAVFLPTEGGGEAPPAVVSVATAFAAVIDAARAPAVVAVDMPIGLPARTGHGGRGPENAVRPLLGGRQSSVFSVPSRAAVYAGDYGAACAAALATSIPPRKVSKQCFHLFPRIREIDGLLRARRELVERVYEVHPEVAFWRLNGGRALDLPKKVKGSPHGPGLAERRAILAAAGLPAPLIEAPPPRGAGPDDYLDALANALIARRIRTGAARPFPDPPGCDEEGLPLAIWA
ncbi:DUF429 domain-containing protein [Chelatococcus sp. SYSU_G07232]|uniref:DUF429 domain-containing protein n=2 Tax=Chelatococcus albus TaxID=3047466 RepID=A0ABT7AJZ8_9HYPH|nr:DUF429 domain-containing protein [Chelatococcus sp. SYSU_G07232]MDJ1159694.1 DUF429 domain-containing protein [Chelatococcus sp. SYSU_G07232]